MKQGNSKSHYIDQLLVLLCLTGFVIAAPVLSIFGAKLDPFYLYNFRGPGPLILYASIVALAPAFFLWGAVLVVGLISKKLATFLYYFIVSVLVGLWIIQIAKWNLHIFQPIALVFFAVFGAAAFLVAYTRWPLMASWLKIAAIAPFISIGFFLFASETSSLMQTYDYVPIDRQGVPDTKSDEKYSSVLFLIFDEFSTLSLLDENGSIDRARFPNIAELADQATWYRHYTVLSEVTESSVPAILTGEDPTSSSTRFRNSPKNLFSLLGPTHELIASESVTHLCGLPQCGIGPPGGTVKRASPQLDRLLSVTVAMWLERVSLKKPEEKTYEALAEETVKIASAPRHNGDQFIKHLHGSSGTRVLLRRPKRVRDFQGSFTDHPRALYYLHLVLPHGPWKFYPNGGLYDLPATRIPYSQNNNDGGAWLAKFSEYRFMMQAQYADSLLGNLFSRMKSLGVWDELTVVFTADHGFSFHLDTPSRELNLQNIDSIAYAPLIIKQPLQTRGRIDDSNLMSYDILPTLADILDIEIPWTVLGSPAGHADITSRGDQKVFFPRDSSSTKYPVAKMEFSDLEHFPAYSSRAIGSGADSENSLMLLNGSLGLDRYWGSSPQNFEVKAGGPAIIDEFARLVKPLADEAPLGAIVGNLEFEPSGDRVLISVNNKFVTGSPLITFRGVENTFIAMLPQYALSARNKIGVYLVEEAGLLELDIH